MIYPAISSPTSQGCIKSSLPVLFRSDSFTMFTSYEQFQNFLLVIYSFGTYGTSLIYSFKIFWLSTPDSFAIPPPRCPPSWSNSIMHPGWQSITKIIHFVSNVDQFGTQLGTFLKALDLADGYMWPLNSPLLHCSHMRWGPNFVIMVTQFLVKWGPLPAEMGT